jgi:2-methylcitrate dehydratase
VPASRLRLPRSPVHPRPVHREIRTLADGAIASDVQQRFLDAVTRLPDLDAGELAALILPGIAQAGEPTEAQGSF